MNGINDSGKILTEESEKDDTIHQVKELVYQPDGKPQHFPIINLGQRLKSSIVIPPEAIKGILRQGGI